MAFEALLKEIPGDFLEELIESNNLSTLLSRGEGIRLFESYLNKDLAKYWNFCNFVKEVKRAKDKAEQKELAWNCWKKHISISADFDDKLEDGLNRNLRDKIRQEVENNCYQGLFDQEEKARDKLNQGVCNRQLLNILINERNHRPMK